eukprot:CAMPEP_0183383970 /NCGR_PEP_ID=MMETSP0370-20130417/151_1 /TAXON_ID=268820 /ORGANISM="Peridinium aciculiferum, Strain PAER-2" /LENGTH=76 /DNA_ID=CAMNT_0025561629 /DNA_START=71 /DNA_END=298 /DNA_ORIENTATION=-
MEPWPISTKTTARPGPPGSHLGSPVPPSKCAGHAQLQAQVHGLRLRQLHHQDQLDQQKRHSQQPVHVAVGIVEGSA